MPPQLCSQLTYLYYAVIPYQIKDKRYLPYVADNSLCEMHAKA